MAKSPDAFRTISEVATALDVPQHVLRFWETKFSQIKPLKRAGGRRYYRPGDVDLIRGIQALLYGDGYTIKGVQRILKDQGVRFVVDNGKNKLAVSGVAITERSVDLEAGKADLPVPPSVPPSAPSQVGEDDPVTTVPDMPTSSVEATPELSTRQRDVMNRVLLDLVSLKARVDHVRNSARDEEDMPLLAKMRAPE